ncbi:secretory phospholipase A2 receptor-like [Sardina pilchardus]|uniref:secretory phospholipase A2 receptor-like n=1 Tax=Sardina pilchardus TaxID=27697 RepID=UPI002E0F198C
MTFTMAMIPILAVLVFTVTGSKKALDDFRTLILVWSDSFNICRTHYTDLVTLYDKTDEEQCHLLLEGDGIAFIGLKGPSNSFKWSNGDPVIYKRNLKEINKNTCVAMKADGDWEPLRCTQERTFICYSDGSSSTLIDEKKSWYEAQKFCRDKYTDLVSITDEEQNKAVHAIKQKHPNNSWIGLKWDGWEWADGGLSGYRNWSSEADFSKQDHTAVTISLSNKWMPATKTTEVPFICYKDHIHISNISMTWEGSLEYCRRFNGSFCILSPKKQLAAKRLMRRLQITEPVWVGLQQSSFLGIWVWTTGETLAWNNWKGGQVPQLPLSHHCGALTPEKDDFKWADMNCMIKQRALCYDWVVNEPPSAA